MFGGMGFDAPSWEPWTAFLAALQALPMSGSIWLSTASIRAAASRLRVQRGMLKLVVGRRGGKSRILALIATYLACVIDHRDYIVPGETPVVAVIARDRTQAKVILNYIAGFLRSIPLFAELIEDELAEIGSAVEWRRYRGSHGFDRRTERSHLPRRSVRRNGLLVC